MTAPAGAWERAVAAAARDDLDETLTCLAELPPTADQKPVTLLLRLAPRLLAEPEHTGRAVAVLAPFRDRSTDARALLSVLDPVPGDDPVQVAIDYATVVADRCGESAERLRAVPIALRDDRSPPWTPTAETPSLAAFDLYLRALAGEPVQVPAGVLGADRSAWPLLRDAALAGRVDIGDEMRSADPDLVAWLDLWEVVGQVYAGNWPAVLKGGRELVSSLAAGVLRDEATNLCAYAEWQSGRTAGALADLEAATRDRHRYGLLVNASVVAADNGSVAALGPLSRLLAVTTDERARHSLLSRAIGLWLADGNAPDYPDALAAMVRAALTGPIADDELYLTLVRFCADHDAGWLADATPRARGAAQDDLLRYFRIRSRVALPERAETLRDLAAALVTIWGRDPRPAWLERERDRLTDLLMTGVHTPFGEAAGLAGVIETLAAGGTLRLFHQIVLTAQAGAHIAMSRSEQHGDIAPDVEQKLVFTPVHLFLRRHSELPRALHENAGEELARCVAVSAAVALDAVLADARALVGGWDEPARPAGRRRESLDRLDAGIGRLRMYLSLLGRLPATGPSPDVVPILIEKVAVLADETTRRRKES